MLELNKISYSSMLSRKSPNLMVLSYFAFVVLVLWSPDSKLGKGELVLQTELMTLGLESAKRPLCFAVYPVDQKQKIFGSSNYSL